MPRLLGDCYVASVGEQARQCRQFIGCRHGAYVCSRRYQDNLGGGGPSVIALVLVNYAVHPTYSWRDHISKQHLSFLRSRATMKYFTSRLIYHGRIKTVT
ncbi:hypothetical protein RB195_019667 [Necator americanus]|uniref:Uncharacterized protein n=1 Tax=Necator americanus TaxID=51031 RepID=A0ABR1CHG6_NECAM